MVQIKKIDIVHQQGNPNKDNEDSYVINEEMKRFAVIDGCTGLGQLNGKIASNILQKALQEEYLPVKDAIESARGILNQYFYDYINRYQLPNITLSKSERSSACFVVAEIHDDNLYVTHSGTDCMLLVQYKNDEVRVLTYDHLHHLDRISIDIMSDKLKEYRQVYDLHLSEEDIKTIYTHARNDEAVMEKLLMVRELGNVEYGTFNGEKDMYSFIEEMVIPLQNVKQIALISDGLRHIHENENDWTSTAIEIFENGLETWSKDLKKLEEEDGLCLKHPRMKVSDDKTGICIHFK